MLAGSCVNSSGGAPIISLQQVDIRIVIVDVCVCMCKNFVTRKELKKILHVKLSCSKPLLKGCI